MWHTARLILTGAVSPLGRSSSEISSSEAELDARGQDGDADPRHRGAVGVREIKRGWEQEAEAQDDYSWEQETDRRSASSGRRFEDHAEGGRCVLVRRVWTVRTLSLSVYFHPCRPCRPASWRPDRIDNREVRVRQLLCYVPRGNTVPTWASSESRVGSARVRTYQPSYRGS